MTAGASHDPAEVAAEVASLLAALLAAVERGELEAPPQLRRRLEAARLACEEIAARPADGGAAFSEQ